MRQLPLFSGDLQETGFTSQENRNTITAKHLKLKGRDKSSRKWSCFLVFVGFENDGKIGLVPASLCYAAMKKCTGPLL